MRRMLLLVVLSLVLFSNTGCLLNLYDSDPNTRMEQLLFQSEDLRQIRGEWRRFWFTNQPSTMTWERVSGVVGP